MCDYVKINLGGVENEVVEHIKNSCTNNIQVLNDNTSNSLQLQISNSLNDRILINALNKFIDTFKEKAYYELIPSWFFDESHAVIKSPNRDYFLTEKEVVFLKMLMHNEKITTYEEIISSVWHNEKSVTQNAIRLFAKNIRKKLPPKILKNFQGIGYKLVL